MSLLLSLLRRLVGRASALLVVVALATRLRDALLRRRAASARSARAERSVLVSLLDVHPGATRAPRRPVGLRAVPIDRIVGTMRHPSQNTADFKPLPRLRGQNWRGRWQRINRAVDRLETLPPVDLVQVGDDYYVADGHNRVAAARQVDAVEIDADVVQLLLPGVTQPGQATLDASTIAEATEVRQAASGRRSPTIARRSAADSVNRRDLVRPDDARFDDRT